MTETTTPNEAQTFLNAKTALYARKAVLEEGLAEVIQALGEDKPKRGRKAKVATHKPRVALGASLEEYKAPRKTRGPNKVKPTVTGIEASEQA
jgi:hypothetical protein